MDWGMKSFLVKKTLTLRLSSKMLQSQKIKIFSQVSLNLNTYSPF